jgi:hypothetical protein
MHRTVAVALVATIVLGSVGCGSGERTETVGGTQLVQRLASACQAGGRAGKSKLTRRGGPVAYLLAQRESLRTTMDEIDHLEAAGAARRDFDAYKRTVQVRLDALGRVASADASDRRRALAAELPAFSAATTQAHSLVVAISERLRMVCF